MNGGLWSPERHRLAEHPGDAEGCEACTRARLDCQARIQFKAPGEISDMIRELHDRRKLAPALQIRDCDWCGFWHMLPVRSTPLLAGPARPRRGWLTRIFGAG